MKKQIAVFLLTYFTVTLIRAMILIHTGFSFINIFVDEFQLIPFVADVILWTAVYTGVSFLMNRLTRKKVSSLI